MGRKGCYELREAMRAVGLPLLVVGRTLEDDGFWEGLDVRRCAVGEDPLANAAVVVQPSLWETRPPSLLLRRSIAVFRSLRQKVCGLGDRVGLTTVPFGDVDALVWC